MSEEITETLSPEGAPKRANGSPGLVPVWTEGLPLPPVYLLTAQTTFLGRQAPQGNITVAQTTISRVHVSFTRSGDDVKLTDLKSHNGTFVNGVRVTEQVLADGDLIRMGDAVFKFIEDGAEAWATIRPGVRFVDQIGGVALQSIQEEIEAIGPARFPVLIQGETGSGKEGVARALHEASRRTGPFRAINCAAIPAPLVESELFGHRKGAFTGANRDNPGLFLATNHGTLLLDEVGDMPLEAQAKLLRVLETREVVAIGAHQAEAIDVRIIGATHHELRALVEAGRFRADLYARLNGFRIDVPPLRDRIEDLPTLVTHLLAREGVKNALTFGFVYALLLHHWPFNVRELVSVLNRAVTVAKGKPLDVQHLPEELQQRAAGKLQTARPTQAAGRQKRPDAAALERLIREEKGNVAGVARVLKRDRALVHRWLKDAGLEPEQFRS